MDKSDVELIESFLDGDERAFNSIKDQDSALIKHLEGVLSVTVF